MEPIWIETAGDGGWSKQKKWVKVIDVEKVKDSLFVYFDVSTWDNDKDGLIYCDSKFLKSLKKELPKYNLDYSEHGLQGDDYVHFDIF